MACALLAACAAGAAFPQNEPTEVATESVEVHPAVQNLLEENRRFAETRIGPEGLQARTEAAAADLETTRATLARVREDFARTRERVETLGLGRAGGLLLLAKQGRLPVVADLGRKNLRRSRELRQAQIEELRLVTQKGQIAGRLDEEVENVLSNVRTEPGSEDVTRAAIRKALQERIVVLDDLIADEDRYLTLLFELDAAEGELSAEALHYDTFVSERVLWIPMDTVLDPEDLLAARRAIGWLLEPKAWTQAASAAGSYLAEHRAPAVLLALLLAALVWFRLRTRSHAGTVPASFAALGVALLRAAALASLVPVAIGTAAWILTSAPDMPPVARSVGVGLSRIAKIVLLIETMLAMLRENGLAAILLEWTPVEIATLRRTCLLLRWIFVPAAVLGAACITQFRDTGERAMSGAGRLGLLIALGVLFVPLRRMIHPSRGLIAARLAAGSPGWLARLRPLWYAVALVFFFGSVLLVLGGYGHTAAAMIEAVFASLAVALAAAILHGIARFWVQGAGRADDASHGPVTEPVLDRIRAALILAVCLALLFVWSGVLPAVLYLDSIVLWTVTGTNGAQSVTVASLLVALGILIATVVAVRVAPGVLDSILVRFQVDPSARYASGMVAQYVLFIAGIVLAFGQLRIGWAKVQWLAAGLSVGIGFGLQELVANFISGVTILLERPIRIGDTVTVGTTTGVVTAIQMRATTIQDFDRKTLVVPNKELITSRITNWDLSERMVRIQIQVGVAYGSDTAKVVDLLLLAAGSCAMVLATPPPQAILSEFGESALVFQLYAFLPTRDVVLDARHALHTAVERALREAGISIAFPQRDLHLSAPAPLTVRLEK